MRGYSKAAMGGYSLLVLIAVFIGLNEAWIAPFGVLMMIFSNFMNHPHFMASYKLFFEMYPKIKTSEFQKNVSNPLVGRCYHSSTRVVDIISYWYCKVFAWR